MKKKLLVMLGLLIISSSFGIVSAKTNNSELMEAIRMYKAGNYSQCYVFLQEYTAKDSSNAIAFYYLGMTAAQIGKQDEAISNYDKAISLSAPSNTINRYATKGKRCLETPEKCNDAVTESIEEAFIMNKFGPKFTQEAEGDHEKLKIEHIMREMNKNDSIDPDKFKDYKDFSGVPTNDEVVAALKTLQNAGFGNMINHTNDLSFLTGNTQQNPMFDFFAGNNVNPQLIQTLLTNSITQGF